jgi:chemotaxis methyl-accepting protein methylase
MTTHDTYWFRGERPWSSLRQHLLPALAAPLRQGLRNRIRVLRAAAPPVKNRIRWRC